MEPPRTARVVAHSMWLTVALLVPVLLVASGVGNHAPSMGSEGALAMVLVLSSPFWAAGSVIVGAATGLAAGSAAHLAARAARSRSARARVAISTVGGALASGAAAGLAALATAWGGIVSSSPSYLGGFCVAGVLSGGSAALLARSGQASTQPAGALAWGLGTLVGASVSFLWGTWLALLGTGWDDQASYCSHRLGVDEAQVVTAYSGFPPQLWCLSGDTVEPTVGGWTTVGFIALLTATFVCGLVALRWPVTRSSSRSLAIACLVSGLVGAGTAVWALTPPPDAVERAHVAVTQAPSPATQASPFPSASPTVTPTPTTTDAESALTELVRLAKAGRAGLLWPDEPTVTTSDCDLLDGTRGTVYVLKGSFTTRDMAHVHGPDEMLATSRANELIGQYVANDWDASGLLAGGEQIHGEWFFGAAPGGAVDSAHIGFAEGVGQLQAASRCAVSAHR